MKSNKLWFKTKRYGWGWTPSTWQGWTVIIIYILLISANAFRLDLASPDDTETVFSFVFQTFIATAILLVICYKKGEPPRWRWGK